MANIFSKEVAYVYGFRHIVNNKLNIGLKTPTGASKYTYITSVEDKEFWKEYSMGNMELTILFAGKLEAAKTAEWFALQYGTKTFPDRFYNLKNNAHRGDESLLTTEDKKIIIDYIEGRGNGIDISNDDSIKAAFNKNRIESLAHQIETGEIASIMRRTDMVNCYERIQVRVEMVNQNTVSKIRARLLENPKLAREVFKPIAVVVTKEGKHYVVNGNTRLAAAVKTPGWDDVPVVYINETEFGSTDQERLDNYERFGLFMNKEEFEIRVTNTKEDLKRNINNYLSRLDIDLSKPSHVDRARQLIYDNYSYVCGSKQQLNGILSSILTDFEKNQTMLKYQHNLVTYDDGFFNRYAWEKYGSKDIATVHVSVSEASHGKAIGYIYRRMRNVNLNKGAVIFHYTSKQEIAIEEKEKWVDDMKEVIKYGNLPISVEVLPHDPSELETYFK